MTFKNKTLLIDCGNTYLKWCLSSPDSIPSIPESFSKSLSKLNAIKHKSNSVLEIYNTLINEQSQYCDSVVLSSVLGENFSAGAKLISEQADLAFLEVESHSTSYGITSAYDNPEKLGNDRWVAMIGAMALKKDNEACIIIDSGTATTIDAINQSGQHLGGVIFPGLALSLKSLSDNTELLPNLIDNKLTINKHGFSRNTHQAIKSGCILGLAGAIDGISYKMQKQINALSPSLSIKKLLCGGNAETLLPYLENDYEYHNNLIMLGLKKAKENIQ